MVNFFLQADRPLSTVEIIDHMTAEFGLPRQTKAEQEYARQWTRKILKHYRRTGVIDKLPASRSNDLGYWIWIGR